MKSFGWAVIGSGSIANTVFEEITVSHRHHLVSVWSRTKSKAEKFAEKFGGKCFDSLEEAVTAEGVDGVYISTPHSSHYEMSKRCLLAGKAVLCEKPVTMNTKELKELLQLAKEKNLYFCEGMWTRFNPVTKSVKESVDSGKIGEMTELSASFCYKHNFSSFSSRLTDPACGGGAILDVGVYVVSYAVMLLGKPDSVKAVAKLKNGIDTHCDIILTYQNGAVCKLSCAIDRFSLCGAKIKGTSGKIHVPMFFKPSKAVVNSGGKKQIFHCDKGFIYQFDKVSEDILSGKLQTEEITHEHSVLVMEILDECRRQIGLEYPCELK